MVLSKGFELNEALISEVNKIDFEMVPVVESEDIGIDFLIEGDPIKQAVEANLLCLVDS